MMETIKVNMTPCEDIKTIHASQNDNEAREWGFELHNNGEKIDSSSISDQMVFKAYEGGTEEILPTNGSTPTTSPFIGDIKYPQGLLSDQEFLYRESPTEEDGLAKITDIKGNTLNWNQLVQNGNFADTSVWGRNGITLSVSDNIGSFTTTANSQGIFQTGKGIQGHKYLIKADIKFNSQGNVYFGFSATETGGYRPTFTVGTSWTTIADVITASTSNMAYAIYDGRSSGFGLIQVRNAMLIDLTQMFGSGNEPSTLEEFTSLFPLSYYAYNQGTLLSFNGNGIKTVGFNQWDEEWEAGALSVTDGSTINVNSYLRSKNFIPVISGKTYCRGISYQSDCRVFYYDANHSYIGNVATSSANTLFTIPSGVSFIKLHKNGANYDNNICINISSDRNGTYEPYTSSTLSLPISTYFPNGMDGVGTDYDELTNTKATTRMARVDLGTLDYVYEQQNSRFYTPGLSNVIKKQGQYDLPNIIVPNYTVRYVYQISAENNMSVGVSPTSGAVFFSNANYTSGTDFKTAMSGVYLVYPLATPTETSFTTASLVTENAEIQLSNEDGVLIGKCTEELSSESGFIDAKIKLADEDGECYSNKIQLHIERSPQ